MAKYPPYVDAFSTIPKVFEEIKKASVPPKFSIDFLGSVGLKSSSYRAMIPILKKLDFLDAASVPTSIYKEYRDDSKSAVVLGAQVKKAYSDLYKVAEYAHKLGKDAITTKLKTVLGVGEDDKVVPKVVSTFQEFVKLSNFEGAIPDGKIDVKKKTEEIDHSKDISDKPFIPSIKTNKTFGISYTINLNLPATTEIEVYNSIFKALKDNLLDE
jgi:hypothetical protein